MGKGQKPISEPVVVAPGVVQQKQGNKTLTSSAQVIDPSKGQARMLADVPELPFYSKRDFSSTNKVVQVSPQVRSSWSNPKEVQVTVAVDGDGLKGDFKNGGGAVVCRVTGIDAPETAKSFKKDVKGNSDPGQKYGDFSAKAFQRLIANKKVEVQVSTLPQDSPERNNGRSICLVTVNGENLSTKMVEAGAAFVYDQFVKPEMAKALNKAQGSAIQRGAGIWKEPNQERPWDYRRRTKDIYKISR